MTRIPLLQDLDEVPASLLEPLLDRRGGNLLKIDRLLLHSPAFAAVWNALIRAVAGELTLAPRTTQMIMTAVAALNDCEYERVAHGGTFVKAGGTEAQLDALCNDVAAAAADADLFDIDERALLALTVEITRDVTVSDSTFAAARATCGGNREIADVVATIAAYNMATRYIVAFDLVPDETGL